MLVAAIEGALDVPRNDAFAYSRIAEVFEHTGSFEPIAYGRMLLIGHILWGQPYLWLIDDRELAGNVAGIVASGLAVVAFFFLVKRLTDLATAVKALLVFGAFQGIALTVPTYMTEPTALALDAVAVLAAVVALDRRRRSAMVYIVAAYAACVASFAVREFAVAILVAIAAVVTWKRRDLRLFAAAAGVVALVACGLLYVWHSSLPGLEPSELELNPGGVARTAPGFVTLGLGLLPLTLGPAIRLVLAPRGRRLTLLGAFVGGLAAVIAVTRPNFNPALGRSTLADDIYARPGASGDALAQGARPDLLPDWAWAVLQVLGVLGSISLGIVLLAYVGRRIADDRARVSAAILLLEAVTLAYGAEIAFFGIFGPLFNDRYLWPLVPLAAVLAARLDEPAPSPLAAGTRHAPRSARLAPAASLVALAFFAVTYMQDSAAYDAARWRAGNDLVSRGIPPSHIDAGLEWSGAHSTQPRDIDAHMGRPVTTEDPFYIGFWAPAFRCFVVSNERLDPRRFDLVATETYRSRLWTAERTLWVLRRRAAPSCAAPS